MKSIQFRCDYGPDTIQDKEIDTLVFMVQALITLGHHYRAYRATIRLMRRVKKVYDLQNTV